MEDRGDRGHSKRERLVATFQTVTDEWIAGRIGRAHRRVVLVAPAISKQVAAALLIVHEGGGAEITVVLAGDEDAYRVGLGDLEGVEALHNEILRRGIAVRRQPGLRIGLLVHDDQVTIWSPTPRSVESERGEGEPNGMILQGAVADALARASGGASDGANTASPQIGKDRLQPEDVAAVVQELTENPPAPVDLSRKARVFSTRFQFVEVEVRGAEWTNRKIQLSTLFQRHARRIGRSTHSLLNADLPESVQRILESRIRPFEGGEDVEVEVPAVLRGEIAHRKDGTPILVPMKEGDLRDAWSEIRDRYLVRLKGFGWLVRKTELEAFRQEAETHSTILKAWARGFHQKMVANLQATVEGVVEAVRQRLPTGQGIDFEVLKADLDSVLEQQRPRNPGVRIVSKNIAWESTQDDDFIRALEDAFSPEEREGWFDEFLAVRVARDGRSGLTRK